MSIKIEDGVPIPPKNPRNGYSVAIRSLLPGQSALLAGAKGDNVQALLYQMRKRGVLTGRYTRRKVDGGVRVWRLPDDQDAAPGDTSSP